VFTKNAKGSSRGLFFTNTNPSEIIEWFSSYQVETVPKTGFVATENFVIPKGALDSTQFSHSQEYQLRQLGLPVLLKHGQLLVEKDYVVCKRGELLKPEQCQLLRLWKQAQAKFRFVLQGYWSNENFVELSSKENNDQANESKNENEDEDNNEIEQGWIEEEQTDMIDTNTFNVTDDHFENIERGVKRDNTESIFPTNIVN